MLFSESRRVLSRAPIKAVISTSPPVAAHLTAFLLKKRHNLPWVADLRDPIYGNPCRQINTIVPYDSSLELLIFGAADAVIANTDAICDLWRKRYPQWADKFTVIWNGFDPRDELKPLPTAGGRRRIISHVGHIYGPRVPAALLASLERLIQHGLLDPTTVRLQLLGRMEDQTWACLTPREPICWRGDAWNVSLETSLTRKLNEQLPRQTFFFRWTTTTWSAASKSRRSCLTTFAWAGRCSLTRPGGRQWSVSLPRVAFHIVTSIGATRWMKLTAKC